ncbi:glycerate kinase [Rossellomorea vietnamensis]|uniref:Glycerate kinase n=1 Tax=Rossellomorea vietnamensis TaxID=218284 RepID=A0A5D4KA76_9BACI|nr:glycerate kinase [Rossellomorea vietnamensis]TYR72973.1 glycerate kinase [Rossellomorea vietnamensis]
MKIVAAPDSFKESMTAMEVCNSIEKGFRKVFPQACVHKIPIADGGEGTVHALVSATNGMLVDIEVTGPHGKPVNAYYGVLGDGRTAVIEMAAASGLQHVPIKNRNPLTATSFGTGELIKDAIARGMDKIILGLGGSATNDGGAGMAAALGVKFFNEDGETFIPVGGTLDRIASLSMNSFQPRLKGIEFTVACDVDNPLAGPEGASHVYGPQKGATSEMVRLLDANLIHFGQKLSEAAGINVLDFPGAGAAGGMGAGAKGFLKAEFRPGVELVLDMVQFEEAVADADLIITGEGRIDGQSIHGKAPIGVARYAKKYNKPVIAIAGELGKDFEKIFDHGINSAFCIVSGVMSLEEALRRGPENVERTAENIARLLFIQRSW